MDRFKGYLTETPSRFRLASGSLPARCCCCTGVVWRHLYDGHAGGISNEGNQCFASSICQALSACVTLLSRLGAERNTPTCSAIGGLLGSLLLELHWRRYDGDREPLAPLRVTALLNSVGGYAEGEHNDAAEFSSSSAVVLRFHHSSRYLAL